MRKGKTDGEAWQGADDVLKLMDIGEVSPSARAEFGKRVKQLRKILEFLGAIDRASTRQRGAA